MEIYNIRSYTSLTFLKFSHNISSIIHKINRSCDINLNKLKSFEDHQLQQEDSRLPEESYFLKLSINWQLSISIWKSLNHHSNDLKIEKYFQNNIWIIFTTFLQQLQIKLYEYTSNRAASLLQWIHNVIQCYPAAILRIILYEVRPILP